MTNNRYKASPSKWNTTIIRGSLYHSLVCKEKGGQKFWIVRSIKPKRHFIFEVMVEAKDFFTYLERGKAWNKYQKPLVTPSKTFVVYSPEKPKQQFYTRKAAVDYAKKLKMKSLLLFNSSDSVGGATAPAPEVKADE